MPGVGCAMGTGGQVDLNKLRSMEKISGRPTQWHGNMIKGNGRDAMIRSGENRDSGSRACHGQNVFVQNDDRSSGAALGKKRDYGKKSTDDGKRKSDVPPSDLYKRSRENSLVSAKRLGTHSLLLDGVNRKEGVESFWDSSDFGAGLRKGATIVGDHDMAHLIPHSSDVLLQSIALNSCQVLSAFRALQAQRDRFRADDAKLRKELTKLKEDASHSEASMTKTNEEIHRLEMENANLKEEARRRQERLEVKMKEGEDLRNELRVLYDKHYTEVQTGGQFLASPAGLDLQKNLAEKPVDSFRASSVFEDDVYRRAYSIHDEVVLDCRRILREKLVHAEIVMLIGPEVPDIDESVFDEPVVDAPLDDFADIEIIEALTSLHGDDAPDGT